MRGDVVKGVVDYMADNMAVALPGADLNCSTRLPTS